MSAQAPMKVLGPVRSYHDLHEIMRAQAERLNVSRVTIDELANLTPGYAAKLLAPNPIKHLGEETFASVLPALAIKLIAVVDEQSLEQITKAATTRVGQGALLTDAVHYKLSRRFMRKIARKGGSNSRKYMTKKKASRMARKAARARYPKARATKQYIGISNA